jgi:GDP-D-mannose 3',5'-epimerase
MSDSGIVKQYVPGPQGVRERDSDSRLIGDRLGWAPSEPLRKGLEKTFGWIETQVRRNHPRRSIHADQKAN